MLNLIVCFAVLFATVSGISIPNNLLVIYGNDHSEIIIRNITTRKTVKFFTIQAEKASGGIEIDYKNDLIFFADAQNMYKIYLVDDNGNRKISTRGELFTNKTANHIEVLLCQISWDLYGDIRSFAFDDYDKMLYAIVVKTNRYEYSSRLLKINPESCSVSKLCDIDAYYGTKYHHVNYHNGSLYYSNGDTIYNITIPKPDWQQVHVFGNIESLSSFTIDKCTNRLFYIQRSAIRVLDGNLTTTRCSKGNTRIVLADSYVTKSAKGIAVYGNVAIWRSLGWSKLYIGEINANMNFILEKNIRILYGSSYQFNNIMIFEDSFKCKV